MNTNPERRSMPREECLLSASYLVGGDRLHPCPALVQDLSPRGVGLIVSRPVEIGAHLALRWQDPDGRDAAVREVDVKRVEPFGDSAWLVSGTFPQ